MNGPGKAILASAVAGLALIAGMTASIAQQAAPTENKGVTVKPLNALDLGPELQGMGGRQLRMRHITIEPNGVLALHDHKERPAVDYVMQGTVIDHRGDEMKEYGAGTSISENTKTVHWVENKGTTPAVVIAIDIFKP